MGLSKGLDSMFLHLKYSLRTHETSKPRYHTVAFLEYVPVIVGFRKIRVYEQISSFWMCVARSHI